MDAPNRDTSDAIDIRGLGKHGHAAQRLGPISLLLRDGEAPPPLRLTVHARQGRH